MVAAQYLSSSSVGAKKHGRVAVLIGGRSAEREVSLSSGEAVLRGLLEEGVDAFAIDAYGADGKQDIIEQLKSEPLDTVFNMLHGGAGENGSIPCLLEFLELPYTGSNMPASALAMDKERCKYLWHGQGLPSADFEMLSNDSDWERVVERLGLPLMVKPVHEGSSIGMSKVEQLSQLPKAYQLAAKYDLQVMAEQWLAGEEYTVAVLQAQALPVIRLRTERVFYDYQAKYVDQHTQYLIPCGLSEAREREIQELAIRAFNSLGCEGWGRVDLMANDNGEFQILEVNTVPGMTSHSLVPMAANAAGLSFNQLLLEILSSVSLPGTQ